MLRCYVDQVEWYLYVSTWKIIQLCLLLKIILISDKIIINELENDVRRLEKITERFSKIGSAPVLDIQNVLNVIHNSVEYIKTRSSKNIVFIEKKPEIKISTIVNDKSRDADLTIIGFRNEIVKHQGPSYFSSYDKIGNILFVNSSAEKPILKENDISPNISAGG